MKFTIRTQNLTKDFGAFTLGPVELELPGGTVMGLIGENGAGKSTLIKCLLGILKPTEGSAELLGKPAAQAVDEVGYVPDECPFSNVLKVGQVGKVCAGLFPGWDDSLFAGYLQKFELPPDRKVKDLSRGMGMKLTIAAALSHRPKLLVLDEATSGLDPVVRDEILDEFLSFVSDEDHAVLISSHITSDLEKVCDYVTYLHKGKITVSGPKDELLSAYAKLNCAKAELEGVSPELLVGEHFSEFGAQALVKDRAAFRRAYPELPLDPCTLEDIMIFTTKGESR